MSTEKPDSNVDKKPTNPTPPPQQPQVIAPTVEEPKPKATKGDDEEDKKKAQQQQDSVPKPSAKKKEESQEKNPYLALNEDLQKMVADINGSINDALKDVAKAGWNKVSNTDLGKAVGGLKDAIVAKAEDLGQQLKDKAGEKLDEIGKSISNTAVGKAVGQFTDSISSLPDMVSKGLTDAINQATKSIQDSMKKDGPQEEVENDETMELDAPKSTQSDNLMAEAQEAFGDMAGWDDLLTEQPTKSAPTSEKDEDLTSTVQLNS
ncbi:hypothetical protein [Legionella parisiensis]|uniref:Uncharacterized protein n=1 Tax=Legionella parisiensis TaxID=45071 RepID=A0A1E5JM56_9GAMM|nr:hypothetical protein [Legionella parisiensis]KTD42658.1 coiled-coil protein [Legionella parisiensis]OEH45611.1 hypothetical protein lpari_03339 [Legionella parisiensis]STX71663.1 coiled-coil protein [Legionella parisiensis]